MVTIPVPDLPAPPPYTPHVDVKAIFKHDDEEEFLSSLPSNIADAPLPSFDPGVLNNELLNLSIYQKLDPDDPRKTQDAGGNITKGTYSGTQVALTQLYSRIEQRCVDIRFGEGLQMLTGWQLFHIFRCAGCGVDASTVHRPE